MIGLPSSYLRNNGYGNMPWSKIARPLCALYSILRHSEYDPYFTIQIDTLLCVHVVSKDSIIITSSLSIPDYQTATGAPV